MIHLLRAPLTFENKRTFRSFCGFMLSDVPHVPRFPFLRCLDLCLQWHEELEPRLVMGPVLAEFFRRAQHLEVLRVDVDDVENLLEEEREVAEALASLTNLVAFRLGRKREGDRALAMLLAMQSPLRKLSLPSYDSLTILNILRKFTPSLEDIIITCPTEPFAEATHSFPHVKRLTVISGYDLRVHPFIHNFPTLKRFHITEMFRESDFTQGQLEPHRQSNLAAQRSWTNLEFVGGSLLILYVLCLSCHGRDLSIDGVTCNNAHLLPLVLSDNRRARLRIRVLTLGFPPGYLPGFPRVTPRLELKYLSIILILRRYVDQAEYAFLHFRTECDY